MRLQAGPTDAPRFHLRVGTTCVPPGNDRVPIEGNSENVACDSRESPGAAPFRPGPDKLPFSAADNAVERSGATGLSLGIFLHATGLPLFDEELQVAVRRGVGQP